MPYCNITTFLSVLTEGKPGGFKELINDRNCVLNGFLSVGVKLHLIGTIPDKFDKFIIRLGPKAALHRNIFRRSDANLCLVLPPMGSARGMIRLLERIEDYTEMEIFDNPAVQIQVCSPGRLDGRRAAYLAIAFYLASDILRTYTLEQFITSVSNDQIYDRGNRIVLYEAAHGVFDQNFDWWGRSSDGKCVSAKRLPFKKPSRTDILAGVASRLDIENINLIATLLVHSRYRHCRGYWCGLGREFEQSFEALLRRHQLSGILHAPWVHRGGWQDPKGDADFFAAMQELMYCVHDDAKRLDQYRKIPRQARIEAPTPGILSDSMKLIESFRQRAISEADWMQHGGKHDPS